MPEVATQCGVHDEEQWPGNGALLQRLIFFEKECMRLREEMAKLSPQSAEQPLGNEQAVNGEGLLRLKGENALLRRKIHLMAKQHDQDRELLLHAAEIGIDSALKMQNSELREVLDIFLPASSDAVACAHLLERGSVVIVGH